MRFPVTIDGVRCKFNSCVVETKSGTTRLACIKQIALTLTLLFAKLLTATSPAHAQTETVLYSFCAQNYCSDGAYPYLVKLVIKNGKLYGTTYGGGLHGDGEVFEMTPSGTVTVLYSFENNGTDGFEPDAGVVFDKEGNLYGTTYNGGTYIYFGTVFKLTPSGTETILHSFGAGPDGAYPLGPLVLDKNGNLYGTTYTCGGACGGVFELTPSGTETILYCCSGSRAGLIFGWKGNLYGTTYGGGLHGYGTVFEATPSGTETVLHAFPANATDGYSPQAGLILKNGNLYGTTSSGGAYGYGTVFELTKSGKETILWNFGNGTDGANPYAGLVLDKKGNLYGTTVNGGAYGYGTVFKLTPSGTETILHSFGASGDGANPYGGLVLDAKGNLYGTTTNGGLLTYCPYARVGCGTVFKVTP